MEFWLRWNPLPMPRHLLWEEESQEQQHNNSVSFQNLCNSRKHETRNSKENHEHQEQEAVENRFAKSEPAIKEVLKH